MILYHFYEVTRHKSIENKSQKKQESKKCLSKYTILVFEKSVKIFYFKNRSCYNYLQSTKK